jgi:dual 3',5'-cyclic-AMP and -GMP phosphodiesterase 11
LISHRARPLHLVALRFRKISAHEFERGGLLKPIVNTIDGTPTFLSSDSTPGSTPNQNGTTSSIIRTQRLSRNELKHLDEKEMIFELVSWLCSWM